MDQRPEHKAEEQRIETKAVGNSPRTKVHKSTNNGDRTGNEKDGECEDAEKCTQAWE